MFTVDSIYLNQFIRDTVKVPADQGRIVALAVAFATVAQAQLPSSPISETDLGGYYIGTIAPSIKESISLIGESTPFNTRASAEYASSFWKMRYYAAHPAQMFDKMEYHFRSVAGQNCLGKYDLQTMFYGGSVLLAPETVEFMNKYKGEILSLAANLASTIKWTDPEASNVVN